MGSAIFDSLACIAYFLKTYEIWKVSRVLEITTMEVN